MHWKNWISMTSQKKEGGMGFKDIQAFNRAMLAKRLWRILTKPNLLMSMVLKARHFKHNSSIDANAGWNAS